MDREKRRLPSWQREWIERRGVYQAGIKGGHVRQVGGEDAGGGEYKEAKGVKNRDVVKRGGAKRNENGERRE